MDGLEYLAVRAGCLPWSRRLDITGSAARSARHRWLQAHGFKTGPKLASGDQQAIIE